VEVALAQLPEESAPAVIVVKSERPSRSANGRLGAHGSNYDPGMMYLLELTTILTLRDQATLEAVGESLLTSLQAFMRDARNMHSLALSRIIYYLLNLLRLSHV
jgi:brefeldin A-resistance guanine nucleotide exchange factor 1